ncbi:MAG: PA2779 family protein [Deltaproteobacteria bacterium]|nr:PA2779 family protein [Deltaproteobacteria bacterium]
MKKNLLRLFVSYLVLSFFFISAIPARTFAYVAESGSVEQSLKDLRAEDMAKVQRVLESKVVKDKLERLGLTNNEINSKLEKLSDEELHQFASHVTSLYPGGDGLGLVIGILIIVVLVIIILQLTGKKIIIRDTGK